MEDGVSQRVLDALNHDLYLAGGAVAMKFDPGGGTKKMLSLLNNLRTRLTGIAFGDQGQFFRREVLERIGGFPGQMLMEDVELSLRLRKVGRLVFLSRGILVSGRRWERGSLTRNIIIVVRLFTRYLLERSLGRLKQDAGDYYGRYYGNPRKKDHQTDSKAAGARSHRLP
jgi:hypothetical protein